MGEILVGCPLWDRLWIIDEWLTYTVEACSVANLVPSFVFVGDLRDPTVERVTKLCLDNGYEVFLVQEDEDRHVKYARAWNHSRYDRMVFLRNLLLKKVREINPEFFLSLDSDILLAPFALKMMMSLMGQFDAVGGKTYMTPPSGRNGMVCPSYGMLPAGRLQRKDSKEVLTVDAIMAIKLMSPKAYAVDYRFHEQGEDLGWSMACTENGLKLGWDGRVCSKHVMALKYLDIVDDRCGF